MSFSRWYPVSPYFYDPSIQPTKPIANLQAQDEAKSKKVPIGRYDTTYRREFLNFSNGSLSANNNGATMQSPRQNDLNTFTKLPPISGATSVGNSQQYYQQPSSVPDIYPVAQVADTQMMMSSVPHQAQEVNTRPYVLTKPATHDVVTHLPQYATIPADSTWPSSPVYLNAHEESSLQSDLSKKLAYFSAEQMKNMYQELTNYDPGMNGVCHNSYASIVAMRNNLPLDDKLLKYVMHKFIAPHTEKGYINYEEMIKYLSKSVGQNANFIQPSSGQQQYQTQAYVAAPTSTISSSYPTTHYVTQHRPNSPGYFQTETQAQPVPFPTSEAYTNNTGHQLTQAQVEHLYDSPNITQTYRPPSGTKGREMEVFDPDEQAILRLMHENMRDWEQVNLINTEQLRRKFQEIDPHNTQVLDLREIENLVYQNRIPIQRSLIYQILEKYCKVGTGQYRWPAFVEFFDKMYSNRLINPQKYNYTLNTDDKAFMSKQNYRSYQLEALRNKFTEAERLEEINRHIYNINNISEDIHRRIDSRMGDVYQDETWFTRFMRLSNAMYSHRVDINVYNASAFTMEKEEARRLISNYNQVYRLGWDQVTINEALDRNTLKGNVIIDECLKTLARIF